MIVDSNDFARQLNFRPYSPLPGIKPPETREEVLALIRRKRAEATGLKADVTKLKRSVRTIQKAQENASGRVERVEAEQDVLESFLLR